MSYHRLLAYCKYEKMSIELTNNDFINAFTTWRNPFHNMQKKEQNKQKNTSVQFQSQC